MPESTQPDGTAAPRLLDVLRETLRVRHYSLRTEQQYVYWVRRFLRFHYHRHPREMGAAEVCGLVDSKSKWNALQAGLPPWKTLAGECQPSRFLGR
ncbi:phage integrase N-terminal SAM-like domain-containing protein [Crenobacter caeni]|uniref:Integrase SAM-like N-terminal domain-containing protein n=1 Tax=Crenobacter caeni TaxID=2705474 RepID=A0A6B2KUN6_9NEIS|nr:hypothetical protein [Crenobacter caeni]